MKTFKDFKIFTNNLNEAVNTNTYFVRITPGEMIGRNLVSGTQTKAQNVLDAFEVVGKDFLNFEDLDFEEKKLIQSVPRYELYGNIENLPFDPPGSFEFPFYILKQENEMYLVDFTTSSFPHIIIKLINFTTDVVVENKQ